MQRVMLHQRHVAIQHQRVAFVRQVRHRLLHRMTSAELWLLHDELRRILLHRLRHPLSTVTVNHAHLLRIKIGGVIQHMLQQRLARQRVQHLGLVGIHARAFAGSEDDDVQRCHV